jgi:hypothetical protein
MMKGEKWSKLLGGGEKSCPWILATVFLATVFLACVPWMRRLSVVVGVENGW